MIAYPGLSDESVMAIPQELQLSAEDIRYLRPIQLSTLTGFHPTYFSAWSLSRHLSEGSSGIIASALGVDKAVVLGGYIPSIQASGYVMEIRQSPCPEGILWLYQISTGI